MTAKASTAINTLAWLTGVMAVIVAAIWFGRNNPIAYLSAIDRLDTDALQLADRINRACTTSIYRASYDPLTEQGIARLQPGQVCVSTSYLSGSLSTTHRSIERCQRTLCGLDASVSIDLSSINLITISKDGGVDISAS